jgi:hypothetical protein
MGVLFLEVSGLVGVTVRNFSCFSLPRNTLKAYTFASSGEASNSSFILAAIFVASYFLLVESKDSGSRS